ncbi:MAG TPA: sigma-70 family RNA polymerase sigma factor [Bryobacteraceae bacterium]|jgi:RNA polymerase sigma-70 factor (ECF subfamily)|nr:sigma-70 family RNA polymerase sigma factor [Bryobacteraceae bacterium]
MILAATLQQESTSPADDAIVRLRRGDVEALAAILPQFQFPLYRFLLRMVEEPALAEDLFQQTWVRVIEKSSSHTGVRFKSWLFSIARNLAIDQLRRTRSFSIDAPDEYGGAPVDRMAADGPDPLEEVLEFERGTILSEALGKLPAILREVLTLRFEEEMSLEQIAEVVDIPLSTVKSRLARALQGLRKRVETRLTK